MARCFFDLTKIKVWRWQGLAVRVVLISYSVPSWLFTLAPEKLDPRQSCGGGERRGRNLHGPKSGSDDFPKKHFCHEHFLDPGGGPWGAFPILAQSQGHRQPPNCSSEAGHSHGFRSLFFLSCSVEHGTGDCPLRVHTCGQFPDRIIVSCAFFAHQRRFRRGCRRGNPSKTGVDPDQCWIFPGDTP